MNKSMPYENVEKASSGGVSHRDVVAEEAGQRIDNYLLRHLKGIPRSRIYRILRKGEVRVNGKRAKPEYRVAEGDRVRIPPIRQGDEEAPTRTSRVPDRLIDTIRRAIIHEDDDVIVVNKPSGVATHGGSGIDFGVIETLRAYWAGHHPNETLELAHRLDRETSGCLIIVRKRSRLRELHAIIREGQMEKRYLALVQGRWAHGTEEINAPLMLRQKQGGERVVKVGAGGKEAVSIFKPIQQFGKRATLMEIDLKTGRTHQIRVHAAHAGHPVAGDDKYGNREFNEEMASRGLKRMFLHAQLVNFTWPNGKDFTASAPLDDELKAVLDGIERKSETRSAQRPRKPNQR